MNQAWLGLHKKLPLDTPCFCKYLLDSDLWVTTVAGTISFIPPSHVWTIIPEICYSNLSHYATSVTTISMTITVDSGAASSVTFSKHRLWHISPPEAPHCRSGRLGQKAVLPAGGAYAFKPSFLRVVRVLYAWECCTV